VVGTPRSRLKDFEAELLEQDWQEVHGQVDVKLRPGDDGDMYVIARSVKRRAKENAMRRNRMRKLYDSLTRLATSIERGHVRGYNVLINRLGRLQERYVQVFGFVEIAHARDGEDVKTFVCLKWKLKALAVSLSPRQMIELFRSIQLVEVWFDTVDDRRICLPRITMPEPKHQVVLEQIKWTLPKQPPPRIYTRQEGLSKNVLETRN